MFSLAAQGTALCYKVLLMIVLKKKKMGGKGHRGEGFLCSLFSIFYIKYSEISEYFSYDIILHTEEKLQLKLR